MSNPKQAPVIKFKREIRECGHNKTIIDKGETTDLIYDYQVLINGEYRGKFCPYHRQRKYDLRSADGYHSIKYRDPERSEPVGVTVTSKAEFVPMIEHLLSTGEMPTMEQLATMAQARLDEIKEKEDAAAERQRVYQLETAAKEADAQCKELGVDTLRAIRLLPLLIRTLRTIDDVFKMDSKAGKDEAQRLISISTRATLNNIKNG